MSLKTRLGLMAGASLGAVGLMALVPHTAAAQTCTPDNVTVSASSAAADVVTCSAGTYPSGIAYSSSGDLDVSMVANGAVVNSTITSNGINLTGNGVDSVSFDSSIGNILGGAGTGGPVLDVTTATGDISIETGNVISAAASTTHGIRATSTGGGGISISRTSGTISVTVAGATAAIEAVTNGGDINVVTAGGYTQGRLRGILAQTSGSGTVDISVGSNVTASAIDGIAAIDTIAGTGATIIVISGGAVNGGAGAAIRSESSGAVTIQQSDVASTTVTGRVDFSGVAGGVNWSTGQGSWAASGASVFGDGADVLTFLGGSSLAAGGSIDLGGGVDVINVGGLPQSPFTTGAATIDFGMGADRFNISGAFNATNTAINFGADADVLAVTGSFNSRGATLDFGSGVDVFDQGGRFFWNGGAIVNLESFNNSGVIYLGGERNTFGSNNTDLTPDDVLRLTGGVFTGSGDSRIVIDANLGNHASQIGCTVAVAADCVDFTGATTAGSTLLTVQDISFSVDGGSLGTVVTLVEGSTAAEHFTLDPASSYYTETNIGPAVRKPVVAYYLQYDEANQRHVLVGAPTDEPFQVGTFAASAQETWRATAGSWLTRQADLRATPGGLEPSRGVWGRVGGQSGERELTTSYSTGGVSLDYDLTHKQRIAHLSFGADVIGGPGWVLGGTVGFVRSDVEFKATPTEATLTGFSGGLYASYVTGPLFVDGLLSTNILHVKADAPQMGIGDDVPMKFDLKSLGGQLEAGWRIPLGRAFVEPLAGVSYVVTRFEDAEVPGGSGFFEFDNTKSLRFGGGARVGMDSELMGMAASYSLTGRYWNESEGEGSATITTASGSSADLVDEFVGDFSEVVASLNLFSGDGGVSGFVNLGGKFGDDYQAVDGSIGVRVRW